MNAFVKVKGTDQACRVSNMKKIVIMHNVTKAVSETSDFESLHIYANMYYVFIGDCILHVNGSNVDFVLFK